MNHSSLLALLLPPVSYDPNGGRISAELFAEGRRLDEAQARADIASGAITPFNVVDLLPDWECVCGLTPAPDATYSHRLGAVLAKLRETGGLSIPYFIELAGRLGYVITIDEFQPFYCDYSILDVDCIYEEDVQWCWQVNIQGGPVVVDYFRAGESSCGEALMSFSDPVIEQVFDDLKPAHTFVDFSYEEEQL